MAEVPHKFEAGTVNAAGAYALGEAIRYIEGIGFDEITKREDELTALAMEEMKKNPYVHIIGSDRPEDHLVFCRLRFRMCIPMMWLRFWILQIAVRAGHHCAQPLLAYLKNTVHDACEPRFL